MSNRRNGDRAVIIGAGNTTRNLARYMKELGKGFSDTFSACLDNNSSLWGTELEGLMVGPVEEIKKYPDSDVVIASIYEKDIRGQLRKLEIDNPVTNHVDYMRMIFADCQVRKYDANHPDVKNKRTGIMDELTVYTAIFGGYDVLREVSCPRQNIKYICFTEDRTMRSDTWEIRHVDMEFGDPVMESRRYKMLPHLFIDSEYSLYMDANVHFKKSPLDYMNNFFSKGGMLFVPHEERDCIYREMAECIRIHKDSPQRLITQAYEYSKDNCPEHSGLFWGGLIGRRHFEKDVVEFGNEWWEHFQKYSRRDQIGLGYLMWKKDVEVSLVNINVRNNIWFDCDGVHAARGL